MACRGTEEWKKNVGQGVSRALKGKPKSQEHREKIRQALLANAPWKGKKLSEEHRKKISECFGYPNGSSEVAKLAEY